MNLNNNYHSLLKNAADNHEHAEAMRESGKKAGFIQCLDLITAFLCNIERSQVETLQLTTSMRANIDKIIKGE